MCKFTTLHISKLWENASTHFLNSFLLRIFRRFKIQWTLIFLHSLSWKGTGNNFLCFFPFSIRTVLQYAPSSVTPTYWLLKSACCKHPDKNSGIPHFQTERLPPSANIPPKTTSFSEAMAAALTLDPAEQRLSLLSERGQLMPPRPLTATIISCGDLGASRPVSQNE